MNHTAISASLPRSSGVAVAARVFPSYGELGYRNAGAASLSSVAAGNQGVALTLAFSHIVKWPLFALSAERLCKTLDIGPSPRALATLPNGALLRTVRLSRAHGLR
jgi:hypothetical protein